MANSDKLEEEQILRDLPLHVAGLLDAQQRAKIDQAISESSAVRDAYAREQELADAVRDSTSVNFDTEQGWEKLSARMTAPEAEEQRASEESAALGEPAAPSYNLGERLSTFFTSFLFPKAPSFAAGAAAAVAMTIGVQTVFSERTANDGGEYLTLSAPAAEVGETASYLVIFKPDVTSNDILELVESTELTLTGVEASAHAFIFTMPASTSAESTFLNDESIVEFYAEIR